LSNCSEEEGTQFELLDYFSGSDFIGLSSYPRICFDEFVDIPEDYYSRVREHTAMSLVISESGWPTNSTYYSTEEEQELFLNFLLEETNELEAELLIWWFMHDCYDPLCLDAYDSEQFFISSGLLNSDGSAKEVWDDWRRYYNRPLKRIRSLSPTAEILFVLLEHGEQRYILWNLMGAIKRGLLLQTSIILLQGLIILEGILLLLEQRLIQTVLKD